MPHIEMLLSGFPGKSSRDYLGWSGCYLVITASGRRLLFDTAGYNERATVINSLAKLSVAPEDVDFVVLSHLHFDRAAKIGATNVYNQLAQGNVAATLSNLKN